MSNPSDNKTSFLDRAVFGGLLVVLAVLPLPFGADRPWSWSLFAGAIGALLGVWGFVAAIDRPHQTSSIRPIFPAVVLFLGVVIWAGIQSFSVTPEDWNHDIWAAAERALGVKLAASISVDPPGTRTALMRLLAYGGVFMLSFQLCSSTSRAERLVRWIVGAALVYACYGFVVELTGVDRVPWYPRPIDSGRALSSTFLDGNAYATYAGLGLLCALSLLFRPSMRRGDLDSGWRFTFRALAGHLFARRWILMLAAGILSGSILMTHSRTGLAVAVLGVSVFLGFMAWTRERRYFFMAGVAAIAVCAGTILAIGGESAVARLVTMPDAITKHNMIYERTGAAIEERPLLGTGHGSFAEVFPMYRGEQLSAPFERAHNSYLELALELGLPATLALVLAIAWILLICFASLRYLGRNAYLPCMGIAGAALVGAHAVVDYSLQIPAVAMTFAALLGVACTQALRLARPESPAEERRQF